MMDEFLLLKWVRYRGGKKRHRQWVGKTWSWHRLKRAMMWQSICIGIYAVV